MLDIRAILERLPHRYPFLLVDRILEFEDDKRIVGIKNVTFNEQFFQGHFPIKPVMPGVLIIEAMAQVGAILLIGAIPDRHNKLVYFTGIDGARFRKPVEPGDRLRIECTVLKLKSRFCKMKGEATVEGQLVAEAEFMSSLVEV
ncbi:MAG: 3-hydroxyacyl-ACP dehydratase FabZ [Acidobacteria bacterium]|nr:3-hydroxyacyl-ACP dehydratase FabZ [Acidobacteriota bacterium]